MGASPGQAPDSSTAPGGAPPGDGEAARITTIEDLAARQQATDSKVDTLIGRIDQVLAGAAPAEQQAHQAAQDRVQHKLGDPGHLDEIRQAIRDVAAEQQAAQAQAGHDAEHERLRSQAAVAEKQPREAMIRGKQRLQRFLFGADPGS
jgi:hypothetical protein